MIRRWVIAAATLLPGASFATNLLTNGSFEYGEYVADPVGLWYMSVRDTMTGSQGDAGPIWYWSANEWGVDWHDPVQFGYDEGNGTVHAGTQDGFFCVDLNNSGMIQQELTGLAPGAYRVSFWMIAPTTLVDDGQGGLKRDWESVTANVEFGTTATSFTKETHNYPDSYLNWEQFSFVANVEDSSATLRFWSETGGIWGPVIDNVTVEAAPVPEPISLLGLGIPALALVCRRRKR